MGLIRAIQALDTPPYYKYRATASTITGGIGQSSWQVFVAGDKDELFRLFQNHTAAIGAGTYLTDSRLRMIARIKFTVDILNATNVPQYYRCWQYVAKKDYPFVNDGENTDWSQKFLGNTLYAQQQVAVQATGEAALTVPTETDLNAVPRLNKPWIAVNKIVKTVNFTLGPGQSKRLTWDSGEKYWNPLIWNAERQEVTAAQMVDAYRYFTGGWLVRQQGTFVSALLDNTSISTSETLSQFVHKRHFYSQIVKSTPTTISNSDELAQAIVNPTLMGSGGQVGAGSYVKL